MQNRFKTLLPYGVVVAVFAVVTIFYFSPQFEGRELVMHDMVQFQGMHKDIADHKEQYGEDPHWEGRMFGGMPSYLIMFNHKGIIIDDIIRYTDRVLQPGSMIFWAMASFWIMLLLWGVNPWLGLIPSLAYGLSTYMLIIIGAGHISKMMALAYAPLMMGSMHYAFKKNMFIGAALTSFFAALEVYTNHPQITYYFAFITLAYWINELVKAVKQKTIPHFAKVTAMLVLAAVLALGANFSPLWYIQEHSKETMRGGSELTSEKQSTNGGLSLEYATAWSYGKMESLNMFIPDFMGGASSSGFSEDGEVAQALTKYQARNMATKIPAYWGDQPGTAGPTYLGAVILFLAVLGMFILKKRSKYWVIAAAILGIMLAWGHNLMWFTELFFNYVPMYKKFRSVSMALVIVQWCVPFLAAITLQKLWKGELKTEQIKKALIYSVIATAGVALLFVVVGGTVFSFHSVYDAQLPEDVAVAARIERLAILRADAWRSIIFVLLSAGTVLGFALNKIKKGVFIAIFAGLICLDLIPVDMRFLPKSSFVEPVKSEIKPTQADLIILKDKTPGYRVANLSVDIFNDATTSYFHRSVGGYHGAKLQRYQDIITHQLSKMNRKVYSMLNTKYFIVPNKSTQQPEVQVNDENYGAAWFVDRVEVVANADQEMAMLDTLDTRHIAVVDKRFENYLDGVNIQRDSTAKIELIDYKVNHLTYKYSAQIKGVVVFSEIFYDKGWSAYIDGNKAPYFRADYILRAMVVPAGEHTVEFRFEAPNYNKVNMITLICSIVVILAAVGAIGAMIYLNNKRDNNGK